MPCNGSFVEFSNRCDGTDLYTLGSRRKKGTDYVFYLKNLVCPLFHLFHNFSRRHKRPAQGLPVTYNLSTDSRGRACAIDVSPEKGHKKATKADKQKVSALIISGAFICLVFGLVGLH